MGKNSKEGFAPYQLAALKNPFHHFAMLCGVGVGKTFTGSHYTIDNIQKYPNLTGFVGANTYDQLTQATLQELFYWLDQHNMPWVIDRRPPESWNPTRKFKKYNNILSVLWNGHCVTIFTRVLSFPNALRGIEFSWYWIDESRDTPHNTHDVLLSRMRESEYLSRGLVTTTTNAEDWVHERFVKGSRKNSLNYGSLHVPTIEAVKCGIITQHYYDLMRASYSPMMAAQELDAMHVNSQSGRAYYAAGKDNQRIRAPWGDEYPNPDRPIILGCDFNFAPAPCVWMIGQVGPRMINAQGLDYSDCIHWFDEYTETNAPNSYLMARSVAQRYPNFFFQVFGDSSGMRGSTSNAGETDYNQIKLAFDDLDVAYTVDVEQANPIVKNRIETMNCLFKNGIGQVRQTYNPYKCPHFHSDVNLVGWKQTYGSTMRQRLDDGGDVKRTHASDGAGYAVFKLFPVGRRAYMIPSHQSQIRKEFGHV